jgi:hypothetical protein
MLYQEKSGNPGPSKRPSSTSSSRPGKKLLKMPSTQNHFEKPESAKNRRRFFSLNYKLDKELLLGEQALCYLDNLVGRMPWGAVVIASAWRREDQGSNTARNMATVL